MKQLLNEALQEILSLRRANEILGAKVEVVNIFAAALLGPSRPQGAGIDVAWSLRKKIDELS